MVLSLGILHISKTCSNAMLAVRFAKAASLIENVIYKTKEDIKKYAVILSKLTANGPQVVAVALHGPQPAVGGSAFSVSQ